MSESGFDQEIVNYICKRLREGAEDSAIRKELMDTSNPNFIKINGDLGVAISYLEYAKKVCPKPTKSETGKQSGKKSRKAKKSKKAKKR